MSKVRLLFAFAAFLLFFSNVSAQSLVMPDNTNQKSLAGHRVGLTDIEIEWNAPGVKGREGKIWGTSVAPFGFTNLGFGTAKLSPWRAGSNENTTFSCSTDVEIEGKKLSAGKYGFHIALYEDSCTLIFSKNANAWGSFFYKPEEDALRVSVRQQKNLPQSREWLAYTFSEPTNNSVVVALEWEKWRIPFRVSIDLEKTVVASLQNQLTGALGFDPPSLQQAANWCLNNNANLDEALSWINTATDPSLGGQQSFQYLSTKANLLKKLNRVEEGEKTMTSAIENGSVLELHGYGRQLIGQKKYTEAMAIFEKNYKKHGDTWPTHVGLARGYSATGDLKKALEHAKIALGQAKDDVNKRSLESMIKTLSEGKALVQ